MTGQFVAIEIPPGVVAKATTRMRSSAYAEVNMVRWIEGRLAPVGGQAPLPYTFASRCRLIHPWFDLDSVYHIAYVCESNVYVDTGGVLTEITPVDGITTPTFTGGYGDYLYDYDTYGTPRISTPTTAQVAGTIPPVWSADNFGALLYVMASNDGRLLEWNPAVGGPMVAASGAPRGRCFVVTPERFIMIFGLYDETSGSTRRFGWCDREDPHSWNFTDPTSEAGFYDVEPASPIITAVAGKFGTVFWTSKKCYVSQFEGLPFVYSYKELCDGATPWSPMSKIATSNLIQWMSEQGPYEFDGTAVSPVPCTVKAWIDGNVDATSVRSQACCVHVTPFSEVWWFFPENGSPTNTRAAVINYRDGWWSQALMPRSGGMTSSFVSQTLMANGTEAFLHETNITYHDCQLPYADTFPINIGNGSMITIKQLMPDIRGDADNLQFQLMYRLNRIERDPEMVTDPVTIDDKGFVNFHTTGRDVRLRMEVVGPLVPDFSLGQHLLDATARGYQ